MSDNEITNSGVPGVVWEKDRKYWRVLIPVPGGKNRHIGRYKDLQVAIQARLDATQGIFPTEEEKRTVVLNKLSRVRMRLVWRELLKHGPTTWTSFDDFLSSVGERPKIERWMEPKDKTKASGPDNFVWAAPRFDSTTLEGRRDYQRQHRKDNFLLYKNKDLRKKFDIPLEEYQAKFVEQGGVCANCKQPEKGTRNGVARWLNVDHNHKTGKVRGLLCTNCNTSLGKLQEDRNIIMGLVAYLDKWEAVESETSLPDNVVPLKKDKT
jgi:hypothetical protein